MSELIKICVEKEPNLNYLRSLKLPDNSFNKLRAALMKNKKWKQNSTIRIAFLNLNPKIPRPTKNLTLSDPLQSQVDKMDIISAIKKIVNERINPICNLNFVFLENNDALSAEIKISFQNSGAWSTIGTDCLGYFGTYQPTMNFGWFDVATVIHEFGHALGLIHEHQNPFGTPIPWNEPAVYEWAAKTQGWDEQTTYNNIIKKYSTNIINGSKFDPLSIMLYFFSGKLTLTGKGTQENYRLSPYDVLFINKLYPKTPDTPIIFYKNAYNQDITNIARNFDNPSTSFPPITPLPIPIIDKRDNGDKPLDPIPLVTQLPYNPPINRDPLNFQNNQNIILYVSLAIGILCLLVLLFFIR
jgi:hypothetical protein